MNSQEACYTQLFPELNPAMIYRQSASAQTTSRAERRKYVNWNVHCLLEILTTAALMLFKTYSLQSG